MSMWMDGGRYGWHGRVHVGQVPVPPTIDDPVILEEITHVFKTNAVGPLYAKSTL